MNVSDFNNFAYLPPAAAHGARRILIKPNLGYPFPSPVTVSLPVLDRVIEDVSATFTPLFDGGIVDATQVLVSPDWRPDRGQKFPLDQIFWGQNLQEVDQAAITRSQAFTSIKSNT